MKRVLLALAVAIVLGAVFWLTRSREGSPPSAVSESVPSTVGTATRASPIATAPIAPGPDVAPAFVAFVAEEARQLDSSHVDASAAEARVKKMASTIAPADLRYARDLALSGNGPANPRVMAAYVVAQTLETCGANKAGYAAALEAGAELVAKPADAPRSAEPSLEDVLGVQQKSFALMAVDALAGCATHDPTARDELIRWGSLARDSTLRKMITERVKGLPK